MGILCYKDLNCPAVASTYGKQRRLAVARDINDLILGESVTIPNITHIRR